MVWSYDTQKLTLKLKGPSLSAPTIQDFGNSRAFYAAMDEYYRSPKRLEQARQARSYVLAFQSNGVFRAEAIPPGTYDLQITLTKTNRSQAYTPYPNPLDQLGSLKREVVVPPGDTPFDLGTLVIHLGATAADSTALTLVK